MDGTALTVVAAAIFLWGAVSARLERADLTAPIVFTLVGAALGGLGLVSAGSAPEHLKPLVEITLVWVLFSDAARVRVHDLRRDLGAVLRLLGLGLPLTVLAGWGLALWLFPVLGVWLALLVGAALAPTDAALGVPVVTNTAVPSRVRRLITVESGLNDGIVTPVVMIAIAGAAADEGVPGAIGLGSALADLAVGVVVGVAVGFTGGWLLGLARRRGWAAEDFTAVAVPIVVDRMDGALLLYGLLSLTLVRMVPVALALLGSAFGRTTAMFIGWFGPRGLASLVFALLALEELGSRADDAVAVIAVTVFLSVLAHGISAAPLAARYGRGAAATGPETGGPVADLPVRGLPRPRAGARGDGTGPAQASREL